MHVDAYLFADAGVLAANNVNNLEHTLTGGASKVNTGLMVSAGPGFVFTIKKWGVLDEVKPLSIRLDLPVFLSNKPYTQADYLMFRWQVGVSRSF